MSDTTTDRYTVESATDQWGGPGWTVYDTSEARATGGWFARSQPSSPRRP